MRDHAQHSGWQGGVGLGVDADREDVAFTADRRSAIPVAVRDAAHHTRRPHRCPPLAMEQGADRSPQQAKRPAGARTPCGELPSPPLDRLANKCRFFGEQPCVVTILERVDRHDVRRQ